VAFSETLFGGSIGGVGLRELLKFTSVYKKPLVLPTMNYKKQLSKHYISSTIGKKPISLEN
jgi:hypothetical protein